MLKRTDIETSDVQQDGWSRFCCLVSALMVMWAGIFLGCDIGLTPAIFRFPYLVFGGCLLVAWAIGMVHLAIKCIRNFWQGQPDQ